MSKIRAFFVFIGDVVFYSFFAFVISFFTGIEFADVFTLFIFFKALEISRSLN